MGITLSKKIKIMHSILKYFFSTQTFLKRLFVLFFLSTFSISATEYNISSVSQFQLISPTLVAGDVVVFEDGDYIDFYNVVIQNLQGTQSNPIIIKSQNIYGAKIRGYSTLTFRNCDFVRIEGLSFEAMTRYRALNFQESNNITVSRCSFVNSGDNTATSTTVTMLRFDVDNTQDPLRNAYNVVENCLFSDIIAGVGIVIVGADSQNTIGLNTVRNNVFRDAPYIINNGAEAIVLYADGLQKDNPLHCLIEGNVFDNWSGDGEIISVKSGRNTIRNNVFTNYSVGSMSLRREKGNVVESNFFLNGSIGVWVYGEDHIVRNNIFENLEFDAIRLTGGGNLTSGSPVFETAKNNLIAHNTVLNSVDFFVKFYTLSPFDDERPSNNSFLNNVFASSSAIDFYRIYPDGSGGYPETLTNTFQNNLYYNYGNSSLDYPTFGQYNIEMNPLVGSDLYRTFDTSSPIVGSGQNIPEIQYDFFGNVRSGDDIGHISYPLNIDNYKSPFMFFPPDVTGYESLPIEASFEIFPSKPDNGNIVMLDARTSKGTFSNYRWTITASPSGDTVISNAIVEDVYNFVYDSSQKYTIVLELLDVNGVVIASSSNQILNVKKNSKKDRRFSITSSFSNGNKLAVTSEYSGILKFYNLSGRECFSAPISQGASEIEYRNDSGIYIFKFMNSSNTKELFSGKIVLY